MRAVQFEPTRWLPGSAESALLARTGNQLFNTPYMKPYITIYKAMSIQFTAMYDFHA